MFEWGKPYPVFNGFHKIPSLLWCGWNRTGTLHVFLVVMWLLKSPHTQKKKYDGSDEHSSFASLLTTKSFTSKFSNFSSTSKPHRNFKIGDFVTLQLMCREKGSLKVNQVSKIKSEGFPHISGDADEILHSKLVLADPKEVSRNDDNRNNECLSVVCTEFKKKTHFRSWQ